MEPSWFYELGDASSTSEDVPVRVRVGGSELIAVTSHHAITSSGREQSGCGGHELGVPGGTQRVHPQNGALKGGRGGRY